ncbi:MAG: hypothetical protein JWM10_702, partial [Myxococcaceae bacterium]|nr:hypothetical protein [Myxococcaceae bacterium]
MTMTSVLRDRLLASIRPGRWIVPVVVVGCSTASAPPLRAAPALVGAPPSVVASAAPAEKPRAAVASDDGGLADDRLAQRRGRRTTSECLTLEQVEARLRNPPGLRAPGAADEQRAITARRQRNGCYPPRVVQNGCCNAAVSVSRRRGQCCYVFVEGGCCGRPLEIDGRARTAALVATRAWEGERAAPDGRGTDAVTRQGLADAWRRDALMEHASVASFARFTLQLMALGAPPEL